MSEQHYAAAREAAETIQGRCEQRKDGWNWCSWHDSWWDTGRAVWDKMNAFILIGGQAIENAEPIIRADEREKYAYEYELVFDGDPYMDGTHERRAAGRFKTEKEARHGYKIVMMRAPHSGDKPNLRIERRLVGSWDVLALFPKEGSDD